MRAHSQQTRYSQILSLPSPEWVRTPHFAVAVKHTER